MKKIIQNIRNSEKIVENIISNMENQRNICSVILDIMSVLAQDQTYYNLKSFSEKMKSISYASEYTAPEMMNERWMKLVEVLEYETFSEETKQKIIEIVNN
tara:strand:+ start:57 stop:359 length:303 start_codon:yes stop_codon:yes gene_type:complete